MTRHAPRSLRHQIIRMLTGVCVVLVTAFALGTFGYVYRRLMRSFDSTLVANVEALATLAHVEEDELEFELTDETMSRFTRKKRPDLFAVFGPDGGLIDQGQALKEIPEWVHPGAKKDFRDFDWNGQNYRGVVTMTKAHREDEATGLPPTRITVFFATSRHELDDNIEDAFAYLAIAAGALILISVAAAFFVARRTLAPLDALARDTHAIDAGSLHRRFTVEELPADLRPLAESFNQLLQRLGDAFERERRFTADAAHELRTPVAVLKSGIQSALISPPDPIEDRQSLNDLLVDVARLEDLCEALLLLSRQAGTGAPPAEMTPEEFAREVRATVEMLAEGATQRGAEVKFDDRGAGRGKLRADAVSLRRIVTNLVENSLRHGGTGVKVFVVLESLAEDGVRVSVEDNGPGIAPEFQSRLFQRFARGDESRTRTTGGAGLGLAISRSLAERHGGRLEFEPNAPRGARFVWTVPAAE